MRDADILEAIDLELISTLSPLCEDDHVWYDDDGALPPSCTKIATARLIMSCSQREVTLICAALENWLGDRTQCTPHAEHAHTRIVGL